MSTSHLKTTADLDKLPDVSDISPETITDSVNAINSTCTDPRQKFIMERLITHLHAVVSETNLTTQEWMSTIQFLTRVGQTCTSLRQEFILLSDVLGVSALVDSINHPRVHGSTENTVLGPFFTEDAADVDHGASIASEGKGEYMYVHGKLTNTSGEPVANAKIETWETDDQGMYDTQYEGREAPDCRGRLRSRDDGTFAYRAVVPVAYPIPGDGPVGDLLKSLGRHNFRPAHLHIMIEAPGYETITTALYPEGDRYLKTDAVFGVKKSLIVKLETVESDNEARARGFKKGPFKLLEQDFMLVKHEEAEAARAERAAHTTPHDKK
ncbi:hypothetical protein FRB96_004319 [Tulasnella sp. 330]|nr:hypothetical protein FRB96_004319 [Tulasnella sp. 330]KAG8872312.1 hypothetical protein FRB97_007770 [Tulasnella sp. 331]KAG8879187.1 hypothetical protein FRB98_005791 [Tulasnella sp. 332]